MVNHPEGNTLSIFITEKEVRNIATLKTIQIKVKTLFFRHIYCIMR